MSKHTPGPWQVFRGHNLIDICREDWTICRMSDIEQYRKVDGRKDSSVLADARLIAAAPELLSMLEEWLQCGTIDPRDDERAKRSFALIAKITGSKE